MDEQQLSADWQQHAATIRTVAEFALTEHFGSRCPDYEPQCLCCQRWRALEILTRNPYEEAKK